ncbi:MAG: FIST N-terminal domain-containing protein, partial [Myxococcota bacterium]|jgi:hypothetical protein|nr:FIST N-terminal domain-containing protein [Myxococcota bacterium]
LVFCSAQHELPSLLRVLSARCTAPFGGCSGEGVITARGSFEGSFWLSIMAVSATRMRWHPTLLRSIYPAKDAVVQLAAFVEEKRTGPDSLLLLCPDGMCTELPALLELLDESLPETKIVGGAAGDTMRFERTYQFCGRDWSSEGAFALLLDGRFDAFVEVSHGCSRLGIEHCVSAAEGALVQRIDEQAAWPMLREYLDEDVRSAAGLPLLTVAADVGDGDWVVRSPHRIIEGRDEVVFSARLPEGTRFQMTRRSPTSIRDSAHSCARSLLERADYRRPALVLHFDCAYRGRLLLGQRADQFILAPLLDELDRDTAWLGIFTYGEIAPLARATRLHNDSLVLCALFDANDDQGVLQMLGTTEENSECGHLGKQLEPT